MAISARRNSMSVGAAACVVMFFAQIAFLQVSAQGMPSGPMLAPTGAPMYPPELAPVYTPEMAPLAPPMYAPAMAPMAPPAYTPEMSLMDAPTYAPSPSVMAPGPSPIESGAARNMASSAGVLFMGLAAFLLCR